MLPRHGELRGGRIGHTDQRVLGGERVCGRCGFDQATGLGSVDVANLIKYWNSVTFKPTTTTFNINPATWVHGKTATLTATVAPSSGSGTPTGSIALTGIDGLPGYGGLGDFPLTAGSVYAPVDNLPGGTYQLTAAYSGDGSYAASKSSPVTVTVTPETGTLVATSWAWNPFDLNLYPLSAGITVPYGAQILLDAQLASGNATLANQATPATGTVTFTDKSGSSTATSTQPMNVAGTAEWATGNFAPGSHAVSESYSGDPSYNAATLADAATLYGDPRQHEFNGHSPRNLRGCRQQRDGGCAVGDRLPAALWNPADGECDRHSGWAIGHGRIRALRPRGQLEP